MFANIMSPRVMECIKHLQSFVDCLVSCSSDSFCLFVYHRDVISWMTDGIEFSAIPHIRFHFFSVICHPFLEFVPEDHNIIPLTRLIWPITPYNIPSLDTNAYFIAHSGAVELWSVPLLGEMLFSVTR